MINPLNVHPPIPMSAWLVKALLELFEGDREFAREILAIAVAEIPAGVGKLEAAVLSEARREIAWEAHTLKGSFLSIGAQHLAVLLEEMIGATKYADSQTLEFLYANFLLNWKLVLHEIGEFPNFR